MFLRSLPSCVNIKSSLFFRHLYAIIFKIDEQTAIVVGRFHRQNTDFVSLSEKTNAGNEEVFCMEQLYLTVDALYERGGWLDKLMESTFDSSILVDHNLKIIHCSKSSARMSGHTVADKVGLDLLEIEPERTEFLRAVKTKRPQKNLSQRIFGKQAITSVFPIFNEEIPTEVIGVLGIITFYGLPDFEPIFRSLDSEKIYNNLSKYSSKYTFKDFITQDPELIVSLQECQIASRSNIPILITGETGTGKEIIAGSIHEECFGNRKAPYVRINCTAIPDSLLESELFGHEKGSFTGATSTKMGKFELASYGTILLDEIGDMKLDLQSKLLRLLEEREFERVGGNQIIPLTARVITSTNKDLVEMIHRGKFREDLYYRLNTYKIHIPPLRERKKDIPLLFSYIIEDNEMNVNFSDDALTFLYHYDWPGNVRQMKSLLQCANLLNQDKQVTKSDLIRMLDHFDESSDYLSPERTRENGNNCLPSSLEETEKALIIKVINRCNMNISKAAADLGISRRTLYNKIAKYNISIRHSVS